MYQSTKYPRGKEGKRIFKIIRDHLCCVFVSCARVGMRVCERVSALPLFQFLEKWNKKKGFEGLCVCVRLFAKNHGNFFSLFVTKIRAIYKYRTQKSALIFYFLFVPSFVFVLKCDYFSFCAERRTHIFISTVVCFAFLLKRGLFFFSS